MKTIDRPASCFEWACIAGVVLMLGWFAQVVFFEDFALIP